MASLVNGLLFSWDKNLDYGQKLVADLSDEQMAVQPHPGAGPGVNHPAWVLSHLSAYHPVIVKVIKGEPFDDPKGHPFGMQSKPEADRSVYASKEELVAGFVSGHTAVAEALKASGDAALDQAITLERWAPVMPTSAIALPYLMLVHENTHFGQLSAWRRIQGLPSV